MHAASPLLTGFVSYAGLLVVLAVWHPQVTGAAERPIPIILDTDMGSDVDDAYALVLAARSPQLDLRAVTTVHGKTDIRAAIAKKLLDQMGRGDVPVAAGTATGSFWLGHEGKGLLEPSEQVPGVSDKPAFELIHDVLARSSEKVVIAPVGGVSNVALLLRKYPEDKAKIERLLIMGGCFRPIVIEGQEFPPQSEVNLVSDAEAAAYVLQAGLPMTFMPADVTYRTKLFDYDFDRFNTVDTPLAKSMTAMTNIWAGFVKGFMKDKGLSEAYKDCVVLLHDPAAIYMLVNPQAVKVERMRFRIESGEKSIRTIVDPDGPLAADVAVDIDLKALSRACADAILK